MINPERLQELLLTYDEEVKLFFYAYGLANLVVDQPVDHVAIKGLNSEKYQEYLKVFEPISRRISAEQLNNREIAIATLKHPLDGGTLGDVSTLEIMEPRPDVIPTTHDLIDHIEILVPDLDQIQKILHTKDVKCTLQSNDNHTTVVVEINEWGQEVKFTNKPILEIIDKQIASGSSKILFEG